MKKSIFVFIFFAISVSLLQGQQKFEKESRINEREVPQPALDFISEIGFTKKVKWFKEQSLTGTTVEAKTKFNDSKYSLEFNLDGEVEDVEYIVGWAYIPTATQTKISDFLNSAHQKTKIVKIQAQYTGNDEALIQKVKKMDSKPGIIVKYEMEIKAKTNGKYEMIEYLFSENGDMEEKSIIIFKNTDNLEH
ncbi:MAG: hypothetical protein AAF502_23515 [Bacteroidota bacterium]